MKVLFLNTPFKFKISRDSRWPEYTKSGTLYYPYWLSYAAGTMMKFTDNDVLLLDAIGKSLSFQRTIKKIKDYSPGLIVMNTNTPTINTDIKFSEEVKKELPNTKIVFVGTHVSALPHETIRKSSSIDFIARGEYDFTIIDITEYLKGKKKLRNIDGITFKTKSNDIVSTKPRKLIENLDILPFVSKIYKKFLDIRDYRYALARYPMIQIWSARGCPNRCVFCQYPQVFSSHMFRPRSPENFVDELEWIVNNLKGVKEIFVEDDTMSIDKKRMIKIAQLIKKRKLDITWSFNGRADISLDVLKEIKKAGCRMIIVGYESGNQEVLNRIKKGITIKQAKRFTLNAKKVGIKIFGCFMIGLPGDTKETILETLRYAKELNPDMAFFQQAVPFPGTEMFEWAKMNGFLITEDWSKWLDENGRLNFLLSYPHLTWKDIKEMREKVTINFYLNPKWIAQTFLHNLHPDEIIRNLVSGLNYFKFLVKERS